MGGLIERCAREFVAAATDLALDVGFARLVTRRRETEMGPYLSRASENDPDGRLSREMSAR